MGNLASTLLMLADGGHMDMDWDLGDGGWIVMMLGMLLFWALVIFGIVWIVRETGRHGGHPPPDHDPVAILDRRFAEGAISPEEYRERRALLSEQIDRK